MADLPKNVALVYDRVNKWGGAEQVLLALHDIFPDSPLFTAVYHPVLAPWAAVFPQVIPSFLTRFPWAKSAHELYPWLTPLAFESFDFSGFDAVISITSSDAKGILTRPSTFHLCYCLTPTRYLYTHPAVPWPISAYLKAWDKIASRRPDSYLAVSQTVQSRIRSCYGLDSQVVYPPADLDQFSQPSHPEKEYFLWVGRLVYHKQPDLLVDLFNKLNLPLVIAGTGIMSNRLRHRANSNIRFIDFVPKSDLPALYQSAKALISVHVEDFGLVYVEAQAAGLPVIALNRGGVGEIVIHNQTGYLAKSLDDLESALANFSRFNFDPLTAIANSQRFSKKRFALEFVKVFMSEYSRYKSNS